MTQFQSEFLDGPELLQLTGYARAKAQASWLKKHGVPYRQDGRRMIVSRILVREWLAGKQFVSGGGPNWASVK